MKVLDLVRTAADSRESVQHQFVLRHPCTVQLATAAHLRANFNTRHVRPKTKASCVSIQFFLLHGKCRMSLPRSGTNMNIRRQRTSHFAVNKSIRSTSRRLLLFSMKSFTHAKPSWCSDFQWLLWAILTTASATTSLLCISTTINRNV